jgi:predicted nucleic acid-binding protein
MIGELTSDKKVYIDVCCLNRPFDSWEQDRVRLEWEAILSILEQINLGNLKLVSSEAIEVELERMTNLIKKENILKILRDAEDIIKIDDDVEIRSQQLEQLGFGLYDSYHLACAEAGKADIFLSTDDRLLKNAVRHQNILNVAASNPAIWLINNSQP